MLIQIAKRVIRAPMSEGDLLKVAQSLIVNPPLSDERRAILTTRKYSDGRSFLEGWRSEMRSNIERIAAEKTWLLQRQQLLHLRVAAVRWIALYNAVGVERRIWLWRDYVQGVGEFAVNPESSWPALLPKVFIFAALQNAVLASLGMTCYGTDEADERHLELLRGLREHAIRKVLVLDGAIQDLDEVDSDLANSLMCARNVMVFPHIQNLSGFLRELGDRIETGSVPESAAVTRWSELCNAVNVQIRALDWGEHLAENASL